MKKISRFFALILAVVMLCASTAAMAEPCTLVSVKIGGIQVTQGNETGYIDTEIQLYAANGQETGSSIGVISLMNEGEAALRAALGLDSEKLTVVLNGSDKSLVLPLDQLAAMMANEIEVEMDGEVVTDPEDLMETEQVQAMMGLLQQYFADLEAIALAENMTETEKVDAIFALVDTYLTSIEEMAAAEDPEAAEEVKMVMDLLRQYMDLIKTISTSEALTEAMPTLIQENFVTEIRENDVMRFGRQAINGTAIDFAVDYSRYLGLFDGMMNADPVLNEKINGFIDGIIALDEAEAASSASSFSANGKTGTSKEEPTATPEPAATEKFDLSKELHAVEDEMTFTLSGTVLAAENGDFGLDMTFLPSTEEDLGYLGIAASSINYTNSTVTSFMLTNEDHESGETTAFGFELSLPTTEEGDIYLLAMFSDLDANNEGGSFIVNCNKPAGENLSLSLNIQIAKYALNEEDQLTVNQNMYQVAYNGAPAAATEEGVTYPGVVTFSSNENGAYTRLDIDTVVAFSQSDEDLSMDGFEVVNPFEEGSEEALEALIEEYSGIIWNGIYSVPLVQQIVFSILFGDIDM